MPLAADYRYRSERETVVPARLEWMEGGPMLRALNMRGSADISGFALGNCLAVFAPGEKEFGAGDTVKVQLLDYLPVR